MMVDIKTQPGITVRIQAHHSVDIHRGSIGKMICGAVLLLLLLRLAPRRRR